MPRSCVLSRSLFVGLLLTAVAVAQVPQELRGSWIGTSDANRDEKVTFGPDAIELDGDRMPCKPHGPAVLLLGDGEDAERAEWSIAGDVLTLSIEGLKLQYRRATGAPKPAEPPTDTRTAGGDNPLAPARPVDPFVRRFQGRDIALELTGSATDGYRGTLTFRGTGYPAEAKATQARLSGRFQAGNDWFDFTAELTGDRLKLSSGGADYDLDAPPLPKPAPTNPLAGGGGGGMPGGERPPALDGVFAGACKRYDHPRGWFSFDLPAGWSIHSESAAGMLLNPGLRETDTLDAILGLLWGRLDKGDQNVPVAQVIEKRLPELRRSLAEQGLEVGEPEGKIATFAGKDVPGAVVSMRGQTQSGQRVLVWMGGIARGDAWLVASGVLLDGKQDRYLPQLKRIFTSMEARPPERNAKAEAALSGLTFGSTQHGRVTPSAHYATYAFAAGGGVTRRLMSNVASQPGTPGISADSEQSGSYEVCGDVLYLYLPSGQETGQVVLRGSEPVGIRIGTAEYARQ